MLRELKTGRRLATTFTLLTLLALAILYMVRSGAMALAQPASIAVALPHAPALKPERAERANLDWSRVRQDADGFVQVLADGGRVELTLDPAMQRAAERALDEAAAPVSSAVLLSVDDGRVLAMAGKSQAQPKKSAAELALTAWAPAASIFKLVTASALVESGFGPDTRVCYHDGVHSIEASNLTAHPRWDSECRSLAFGVAKSQNAIIARLAHDHLDPRSLEETAHALGFGARLPFALPVAPSEVAVPRHSPLEFARTAAGFWRTTLSPLHGAYLAATLARGGVTPSMRIVDRVVDRDGESRMEEGPAPRRVISESAARAVARMMVGTTEYGTARLGFHDKRGRALLPVAVAGKTGTLNRPTADGPFLSYSWFVGFAPAERPEVAVAVLVANGENWHKRAHQVAAELLSSYFNGAGAMPTTRFASR